MSDNQKRATGHGGPSLVATSNHRSATSGEPSNRYDILCPTDVVNVETTYATRELVVKELVRRPYDVPDWTTLCFRGRHERAYLLRGQGTEHMLTVPVSTADRNPPKLTSPERSPENEIVVGIERSDEDLTIS